MCFMNPRKELARILFCIIIPLALFLLIGMLKIHTNILQPLDTVDISHWDISFVWDLFYILIYATIMFGPLLYWWGHKKEGIVLAVLLSAAGIFGLLSKTWFKLPRPPLTTESNYGYPSFHAEISVIGWGYFTKYAGYILFLIPVLTGISRMGSGDHYFTDVLGGWLLGVGCLYCYPYLARIRVPEPVWKRWVIILLACGIIYGVGHTVEFVPLILGLLGGFFIGSSAIKRSWKPVNKKKGVIALVLGVLVSVCILLSALVLPEVLSAAGAGFWMSVCPLLFVQLNLHHYIE